MVHAPGHAAPPEELARARRALSSKVKQAKVAYQKKTQLSNKTRVYTYDRLALTDCVLRFILIFHVFGGLDGEIQ